MRFSRSATIACAALVLTTLNGCVAALIPIASSIAVANRGKADNETPAPSPSAEPSVIVEAAATPASPVPAPAPALNAWPVQAAGTATASAAPQTPPAVTTPLPAPQGRLQVPRIDVAHMQEMVRTLASDDFAGRAPSTNEEAFVLDYIVRQFEAAGLKPGNRGSWLQAVQTTEITGSGYSQLAIAGGVQPVVYEFGSEYVAVSPSGPPRSELKDAPLVFVGFGVVAPELGWNDYAGLDMKGKVAVVLVNDPDYAADAGPFGGRRMTYYGRWTYKLEEAARQGAAGVLLVHEDYPAGYGWNVVRSGWSGPQNYVDAPGAPANPTAVQGWIQLAVAKEIFKAARKDFDVLAKAARAPGFKPVELGVTATASFVNAIRKAKSYNVIGVLPGATRPDEYVLYTAHWDHLGRCEPEAKDKICNGAVDNATGVAAIAEIAAMSNRAGPAPRSQVFIATTLEEAGLLGSEHYAQNPVFPLGRTVAGINIDSLRPGGWTRDVVQTGGDKSDLTAYLAAATREMRLAISPEASPERGSFYRSDHFSFARRGVPMLSLARGLDLTRGGTAAGKAAADDYDANRYHGPLDEYGPDWEWSGIMQDVELAYRVGRLLAESSAWPNWHPGDEFRAERDKSAAERGQ
jgi:Zn-dependent M28 family amino/carboxypeptidase